VQTKRLTGFLLPRAFQSAYAPLCSEVRSNELDVVCPPRGAYADSIATEFTGELLQQLDGIASDSDAIFLCGASNRRDQIDEAILSRFAEQIEISLPDETARRALLEVFLGPMPFQGDRERIVAALAGQSEGQSGRDLRALVNQAVLNAVKRTSSPGEFGLSEEDFVLCC
jgi:transitional endoplasmic reticulum ATPase